MKFSIFCFVRYASFYEEHVSKLLTMFVFNSSQQGGKVISLLCQIVTLPI